MTDPTTDRSPSASTDPLRSAALLTGAQVLIALLGAVLLTNGLLA
jgi:hypothetical protein